MLRFITRKDFDLLQKGETKTVTLYDKKEAESRSWRPYLESQGGAVCVQVREISELERAMLEGAPSGSTEIEQLVYDLEVNR